MMTRLSFGIVAAAALVACSRTPAPSANSGAPSRDGGDSPRTLADAAPALPAGASACAATDPKIGCLRFQHTEEAFRWITSREPLVLAVGEAHAQKGTEAIASSTKRFTDALLPMIAPRSSDVVVELWAPDPRCQKEVKAVASAQRPVVEKQAATNQNEYEILGTKAKEAGMTPWLLRPTCDDFSMLADAGDDAIGAMLGLVKRLTSAKVKQLLEKNAGAKTVVAYGGAMHNDLDPPATTKDYSFGPELDRATNGRYVELDLIVPEYVKKTPTWEKLPWYASFVADEASDKPREAATVYVLGERSFVLVFPATAK